MSDTTGRMLSLLSLLQASREWPGPELARRLDVTERTVRNDVQRLRELGYPVRATRGAGGGYRLAAGSAMPPLLLDDEESVAIAVSLLTASGGSVAGLEESSLRALTKLRQVLPARLASRVEAFGETMLRADPRTDAHPGVGAAGRDDDPDARIDGAVLTLLAAASRDRELIRFGYLDHAAVRSERRVEPYRLVSMGRRWYHVAFDVDRDDWRTFRVDRMADVLSVGHRFAGRDLPTPDVAGYVAQRTRQARMRVRGTVIVRAPVEVVRRRIGWWGDSTIELLDGGRCRLGVGGTSFEKLAFWLGALDVDFEVVDSPQLAEAVRSLAQRYTRAA